MRILTPYKYSSIPASVVHLPLSCPHSISTPTARPTAPTPPQSPAARRPCNASKTSQDTPPPCSRASRNSAPKCRPSLRQRSDTRSLVSDHLIESLCVQGFIPRELVANEVNWFYSHLGIDDTYFQNESPSIISDHIIALFGAKVLAFTKHDPNKLVIDLERIDETGNNATFIHNSPPGLTSTEGPGATCESRCFRTFHIYSCLLTICS